MNNSFQYISTFISLILGLGVASLLANYADYLKNRERVRWYWLHVAWSVFMLLGIASEWWVSLNWLKVPTITYFQFLFMLAKPCALFFAASLLIPDSDDPAIQIDLRTHFFSISRPFFIVLAVYQLLDGIDTLLKGVDHFKSLGTVYPIIVVAGVSMFAAGAVSRRPNLHALIVILAFIGMLSAVANAAFSF